MTNWHQPEIPLVKKEQKKLDKLEKKYIRQLQEKKQLTENLQKKKKHKFACCLTSVLLVVVLICGALFGGTFFIYNSYAKDYTGISYFEAVGMIFGLYGADEDKIITNPFNIQEDTDAFFTGLQQSLYLDTKFTIDKLLALIPKEEGGTGDGSQTMATLLAEGTPPEKEEPSGNTSTGNQMLDDLLGDTKFDFSELKDFDGTKKTEFFISDKMIAGILQNVLLHANSIPNVAEAINSLGFDILSEVEIKQTIINLDEQENAHLKLTIQVKVKEIVKELVKQIQEIPPFVKNIISGIVPKNIYLSASISPTQKADPVLSINSIDDNLVQTLLYSLDSKFDGKITNIFNTISETLYNTYMQVQEFAGINGIKFAQTQTAGGISLDALQIVMHAMKVENVTSSDFLLMVKHLHSVDLSGITKEEYLENLDNYSTIESFNSSRDTLLGAYGISDTQSLTPENFIDELPNIVSKVNIKNYKNADGKPLYQCSNEELIEQSRLSDSALAQVFNGFLRNPNGDNSTASAVSLLSKDNEENIALPFDIEVLELTLDGTNINIIASISLENLLKDILPSDKPFYSHKRLDNVHLP